MIISEMFERDVDLVLPLYIEHYNQYEESCWTEETAGRRIRQVVTMQDAFSMIMKDNDKIIGFAMGYFKQYDDLMSYNLEEIVIAHDEQGKGYGSKLLSELEEAVKKKGAEGVELQAVKDEMHERYYGKAGYLDAGNFILKCKWFE